MEIARFMVAYIFLLIGFMMSFIICFADQEAFQNFPGMFIKVISITSNIKNSSWKEDSSPEYPAVGLFRFIF